MPSDTNYRFIYYPRDPLWGLKKDNAYWRWYNETNNGQTTTTSPEYPRPDTKGDSK